MNQLFLLEHLPHTHTFNVYWFVLCSLRESLIIENSDSSAYPIDEYPAKTRQAAAIMLMIMNNLDPRVAQVNNVP